MNQIKSTDIFNHIRPKLGVTVDQKDALYDLIGEGAKIETIARLVGLPVVKEDNVQPAKSGFKLSSTSLEKLSGVDPKLVNVVKRAIELTEVDFRVLEGVRSKEQAYINYGKGRTAAELSAKGVPVKYAKPKESKVTWLNNPLGSKHISGKAVDLVPLPVDWNNLKAFDMVASAMFKAAKELGVKISWGADWNSNGVYREKGESDSPHFEID